MKGMWLFGGLVLFLLLVSIVLLRNAPEQIETSRYSRDTLILISPTDQHGRSISASSKKNTEDLERNQLITIRVIDSSHKPIREAQLALRKLGQNESLLLGHTDLSGRLTLKSEDFSKLPATLDAHAMGFLPASTELKEPLESSEIEIILERGGVISGQCVSPNGAPLAGARVVAFLTSSDISASDLDAALTAQFPCAPSITRCDDFGQFSIGGLIESHSYSLFAAGSGYATSQYLANITASMSDVRVKMVPLFGAALRISAEDGRNLHELASRSYGGIGHSAPSHSHLPAISSPIMRLAGVSPQKKKKNKSLLEYRFFALEASSAQIGPFRLHCNLPGYENLLGEYWADRVQGEIRYQDFLLKPTSSSVGTIRIRFLRPFYTHEVRQETPRSIGTVHIKNILNKRVHEIQVYPSEATFLVENLPFGEYDLFFVSANSLTRYPHWGEPKHRASIGADLTEIVFDNSGTGAIEVRILEPGGDFYKGKAIVNLAGSNARRNLSVFSSSPYIIESIPVGYYQVVAKVKRGIRANELVSIIDWQTLTAAEATYVEEKVNVVEIRCDRIATQDPVLVIEHDDTCIQHDEQNH